MQIDPRDTALKLAMAEYANSGGTPERLVVLAMAQFALTPERLAGLAHQLSKEMHRVHPRRELPKPRPARGYDDIVAARSRVWKHYKNGDGKKE